MTDLIIIGGGPAGLSAALYVLRAGFSVKIFAKDNGALNNAEKIGNYLGFSDIGGKELLSLFRKHAAGLGAEINTDEVTGITWDDNFTVTTPSCKEQGKVVLIASGMQRKKPLVKGFEKYEGNGISFCAVCDAFFYRGKNVAVMGNGEFALKEIQELKAAKSISLLTDREEISAVFPDDVRVYNSTVKELFGNERLEGVRFSDGNEILTDGLFMAQGTADAGAFAKELGLVIKNGKIAVDENMKTSLNGVFAAGDCTGGIMQVSAAVGNGAKAGLSAVEFLRKL